MKTNNELLPILNCLEDIKNGLELAVGIIKRDTTNEVGMLNKFIKDADKILKNHAELLEMTEGQKQAMTLYYKYKDSFHNPMQELEDNIKLFMGDCDKSNELIDYVRFRTNN